MKVLPMFLVDGFVVGCGFGRQRLQVQVSDCFRIRAIPAASATWLGAVCCLLLVLLFCETAHAKIGAIYGRPQLTLSSSTDTVGDTNLGGGDTSGFAGGLRLGARLLIFEGYVDHTPLGERAETSRAVLGVRAALGSDKWRLVGNAGVGWMGINAFDNSPGVYGPVARAGVSLEREIVPFFVLGGVGLETERYWLRFGNGELSGTALMLSGYILFELGV